jgi:four helix bundle protein
MKDFEEMEV